MSNGTTDYQTLCAQIADWANRQDWSPALVASFVSMAEQKMNSDLRVSRMIATAQNTVTCGCAPLPDDWLEMDLLLMASQSTPTGWVPLTYKARDEFFRLPAQPYSGTYVQNYNSTWMNYTIEGTTLYFGGAPNAIEGTLFQMNYYQEVPVMANTGSSWVYTKYPRLYLFAALANADLHAVGEEQTAMMLGQEVDKMIQQLNNAWMTAKASGSRLKRTRVRSFG
jgi:hypothetical protein